MKAKKQSTKVLKGRKKKHKKTKGPGVVIRVSPDVLDYFEQKRNHPRSHKTRSWDVFFRSVFGLPGRSEESQSLVKGWLELNSGRFYLTQAEARGQSVVEAARQGTKKVIKPIAMREVRW